MRKLGKKYEVSANAIDAAKNHFSAAAGAFRATGTQAEFDLACGMLKLCEALESQLDAIDDRVRSLGQK